MNKYDWSNVPKEVKWIATDEDGMVNNFGSICRPSLAWCKIGKYGYWVGDFISNSNLNMHQGNWQDSLEERPNDPTTD